MQRMVYAYKSRIHDFVSIWIIFGSQCYDLSEGLCYMLQRYLGVEARLEEREVGGTRQPTQPPVLTVSDFLGDQRAEVVLVRPVLLLRSITVASGASAPATACLPASCECVAALLARAQPARFGPRRRLRQPLPRVPKCGEPSNRALQA